MGQPEIAEEQVVEPNQVYMPAEDSATQPGMGPSTGQNSSSQAQMGADQ